MSQDQTPPAYAPKPKSKRGFASMDPKLVADIARKGGKAAHVAGTAHTFSSDEAREAGKKGGVAAHAKKRAQAAPADPPNGNEPVGDDGEE
jgi:general stress protein YciG